MMKEKEKATGPSILEDVERPEIGVEEQMKAEDDSGRRETDDDTSDMSAAAKLLRRLKILKERSFSSFKHSLLHHSMMLFAH